MATTCSPSHRLVPILATALLCVGPLGCGDESASPGEDGPQDYQVDLVVGNISLDFLTGTLGLVDTHHLSAVRNISSIHPDHVIRYSGGNLFVINRMGADNIQRLDTRTFATIWQYSTEPGSNPYDLAVVDATKAYVPRYDRTSLVVVNPSASDEADFIRGTIDLEEFADEDGLPEVNAVAVIDDIAYVTLQRLDRDNFFQPTGESYLVAIDTETDTVAPFPGPADYLVLPYPNPTSVRIAGDQLWIGCAGSYGVNDGAIVPFDPTSASFLDPLVTEEELGGDLGAFTATTPLYVIWTDSSFAGNLVAVKSEPPRITPILSGISTSQDIEADEIYLFVADRSETAAGIRIFDRSSLTEVTTSPISTGLPPWELEWIAP